ncbi:hypothetical protein BJX61DRAFT_9518 [Aspergillus egyptiacus]|nr:hypothetical protein BJX61DRAFT_9518 [Aspergillus egyptiacus]
MTNGPERLAQAKRLFLDPSSKLVQQIVERERYRLRKRKMASTRSSWQDNDDSEDYDPAQERKQVKRKRQSVSHGEPAKKKPVSGQFLATLPIFQEGPEEDDGQGPGGVEIDFDTAAQKPMKPSQDPATKAVKGNTPQLPDEIQREIMQWGGGDKDIECGGRDASGTVQREARVDSDGNATAHGSKPNPRNDQAEIDKKRNGNETPFGFSWDEATVDTKPSNAPAMQIAKQELGAVDDSREGPDEKPEKKGKSIHATEEGNAPTDHENGAAQKSTVAPVSQTTNEAPTKVGCGEIGRTEDSTAEFSNRITQDISAEQGAQDKGTENNQLTDTDQSLEKPVAKPVPQKKGKNMNEGMNSPQGLKSESARDNSAKNGHEPSAPDRQQPDGATSKDTVENDVDVNSTQHSAGAPHIINTVSFSSDASENTHAKDNAADSYELGTVDSQQGTDYQKASPTDKMQKDVEMKDTSQRAPEDLQTIAPVPDPKVMEIESKTQVRTISTSFAHPVSFDHIPQPSKPCHWCSNPAYGIIGLGKRAVKVMDSGYGRYKEIAGGHTQEGHEPSRMCVDCTRRRLSIVKCPEHRITSLDGLNPAAFDYIAAYNSLASGSARQIAWCSLCPTPAFFQCGTCSPAGSSPGCGLLLCETCMILTRVFQGDIARVVATNLEEDPQDGCRADVDYLLPENDLYRHYKKCQEMRRGA